MSKEEVLDLLNEGKSVREVAETLKVSTQYVWQVKNPDKIDQTKRYAAWKRWRERNQDKYNAYQKEYQRKYREEQHGRK